MSWAAVAGAAGAIGGAILAGDSADDAAEADAAARREGQAISQKAIEAAVKDLTERGDIALEDIGVGFEKALTTLGEETPAFQLEQALTGVLGPEAQQEAFTNFLESPGQEFLRKEQEQALLRNEAAIGGLGGGRVRTALQEQAFGRASTNLQQALENIRSVRGSEQQIQANIANLLSSGGVTKGTAEMNIATALANARLGGASQQIPLAVGAGEAEAAGIMGQSNAAQAGIEQFAGSLGEILSRMGTQGSSQGNYNIDYGGVRY